MAAEPGSEEVGNRIGAEFPEIGCDEHRHQHIAAGPPEDEGEAVVAERVKRAGHADERGAGHPVRRGRHAVVDGGNASAGDVILDLSGSFTDAARLAGADLDSRFDLNLFELGDKKSLSRKISFKHLQMIEGEFQLPEDFEPDMVTIDITTNNETVKNLTRNFPWEAF